MTDDITILINNLRKYFEKIDPREIFHHAGYPHRFKLDEVLNEFS